MTTNSDEREWDIEELLHRRTDLSTFVIHWTRNLDGNDAKDNLLSILEDGLIEAHTPMGAAKSRIEAKLEEPLLERALNSQKVVCFTEAPLEQAWSLVCNIRLRQIQLAPFGIAFTKRAAREMGVNPVWYVDMSPSGHDWIMNHIWGLVDRALNSEEKFQEDPIAKVAPFVEGMGTWPTGAKKEFWWEREWRHLGPLPFLPRDLAVALCPEEDMEDFKPLLESKRRTVPMVDPRWGLERMIAHLAGASVV